MTTNLNAEGPMGNHPRNAEELHRWAWNQHAPNILAAMNIIGDPGPVPVELMDTPPIEWPDDEEDDFGLLLLPSWHAN